MLPLEGTDADVVAFLGQRLAAIRLDQNLTQEALAVRAGVSRSTVRRLEAGESTQLTNLVRVLRALGILANLESVAPAPDVRPMRALEGSAGERRRASSPSRRGPDAPRRWSWGDEA